MRIEPADCQYVRYLYHLGDSVIAIEVHAVFEVLPGQEVLLIYRQYDEANTVFTGKLQGAYQTQSLASRSVDTHVVIGPDTLRYRSTRGNLPINVVRVVFITLPRVGSRWCCDRSHYTILCIVNYNKFAPVVVWAFTIHGNGTPYYY